MFIQIKNNLKNYGKDLNLWYHPHQGEIFSVFLDTKKGYLVHREGESQKWLVKYKHAQEEDQPELSVDDIV